MYFNNKRLALSIFWMILGAVLIALSVTGKLNDTLYAGMGGALMAVGDLQILRTLRYRTDASYREKTNTTITDERNAFLRMKSWSWTGFIVILVEGIGVIVAMILGYRSIQLILSYSVCLILVVYWISYLILAKKY